MGVAATDLQLLSMLRTRSKKVTLGLIDLHKLLEEGLDSLRSRAGRSLGAADTPFLNVAESCAEDEV